MPIRVTNKLGAEVLVPFVPDFRMCDFLRYVLVPMLEIECVDDTAYAKISTPDLRVVFNRDCNQRLVKEFLSENAELVVHPWPANDPCTLRSLRGNAGPGGSRSRSPAP